MKLVLENDKVGLCVKLLDKLSLAGKKSRHRTKLSKILNDRAKELMIEEQNIKTEYGELDEEGEPLVVDGRLKVNDMESLVKDLNEFYKETFVVSGENVQLFLSTAQEFMDDCPIEWEGEEAYTYNYLCDAFQGDEE